MKSNEWQDKNHFTINFLIGMFFFLFQRFCFTVVTGKEEAVREKLLNTYNFTGVIKPATKLSQITE